MKGDSSGCQLHLHGGKKLVDGTVAHNAPGRGRTNAGGMAKSITEGGVSEKFNLYLLCTRSAKGGGPFASGKFWKGKKHFRKPRQGGLRGGDDIRVMKLQYCGERKTSWELLEHRGGNNILSDGETSSKIAQGCGRGEWVLGS